MEKQNTMDTLQDSFFEFATSHSMIGHFELLLDNEEQHLEIFAGYTQQVMEMAKQKQKHQQQQNNSMNLLHLNGTPQFLYTKINIATNENLETLQDFKLLWSERVQERLKYGSSYLYFPYVMDERCLELKIVDSVGYRKERCEKIKKCLFEKMNLKDCFHSLTIQTVMLLHTQNLTQYYNEKRMWMVENLKYSTFPIMSGRKNSEIPQKSFRIVELTTPEEMVQFWTCQSDAFSGVPQLCEELKNILRSDTHKIDPDSPVKNYVIGIEQQTSDGTDEVVACGKLVMGKHVASINHVATREEHRNQGFATILMVAMIDMAKQFGYSKIVLEATEMGIGIYEKFGFKPFYDFYIFELDHEQKH